MTQTLILDNGAYSIKAGFARETNPRIFPNAVFKSKSDRKRVYVADELDDCTDRSALFFVLPFEKGYPVNWDTQLQIWNRVFGTERLNVDFQESKLVLTDPNEVARAFVDNTEEIIFENFRFHSLLKTSASSCTAASHCTADNPCCLVVDSGHSFTHIVPFVQGQIVRGGVIRIDVGGKTLTNQLKDWISYRQLNVMDETYIVNCCKEDSCFVSTNFQRDLNDWRSKKVDYILPDFLHNMRGEVRPRAGITADPKDTHLKNPGQRKEYDQQGLVLGVERFSLPELLFHPSDVEIEQMGIVEAISVALKRMPLEMQMLMARNIVLIGGNSCFPGYRERIESDLRPMVDEIITGLGVSLPRNPVVHAWECAREVVSSNGESCKGFAAKFVSRTEYEEHGAGICRRRFANYHPHFEATAHR